MAYSGEGKLIEGEIANDPSKTIRSLVCDSDGHLIVDTSGMSVITGSVMIEDSTGMALNSTSGSLNVDVTNFPTTQPISGTVTANQGTSPWVISGTVTETNIDKNFGTWDYYAGTNGTVVVSAGQRILGIGCHSTTGGSFTINGGTSIPIPVGVSINIEPLANLIAPTIVFTTTDSYFVEVIS